MTDTAEIIVRALAAGDPTAADEHDGTPYCTLCDTAKWNGLARPANHDPDCPWRLAVEWVSLSAAAVRPGPPAPSSPPAGG